jgi:membrane protein insertase Oxa1/YidC/SpoIIIJ
MDYVLNSILILITFYFVFDSVRAYRTAAGTVWHRCLAAGKESLTILWARFTVVATAIVTELAEVADVFNAPGVSAAITTYLKPSVVAAIMVTCALITEFARRRTLPR